MSCRGMLMNNIVLWIMCQAYMEGAWGKIMRQCLFFFISFIISLRLLFGFLIFFTIVELSNENGELSWGGGYYANFLRCQNTRSLLKITFIFDRCSRSWAVVALVKYKWDSNNLKRYFHKIKNFVYGEINERSFSNPHTWCQICRHWW